MAAQTSNEDEPIAAINVTPLVDVMLVLLVIFMITAPVLYQSAIKVELPKAASGEQLLKSPLEFTITQAGEVLWDGKALSWDELSATVVEAVKGHLEETAVISADQATPHGSVIRLMDMLRQAGMARFALHVDALKPE